MTLILIFVFVGDILEIKGSNFENNNFFYKIYSS